MEEEQQEKTLTLKSLEKMVKLKVDELEAKIKKLEHKLEVVKKSLTRRV